MLKFFIDYNTQILGAIVAMFSFFAPALAWIGLNATFFTPGQIKRSLWASALFALLAAGICFAVLFGLAAAGSFQPRALRLAAALFSALLLCLGNENILKEMRKRVTVLTGIIGLIVGISLIAAWISLYINLGLLLIYLISAFNDFRRNITKPRTILFSDPPDCLVAKASDETTIKFKHKPNIYFFYLESMHSGNAINKIYHSDYGKELEEALQKMGFSVFPDAYSNYTWTLDTRESVFNMAYTTSYTASTSKADFRPEAIRIFRDNGYKIHLYDPHPFVFGHYSNFLDYAYYKSKLPPYVLRRIQLFCPLFTMSSLFRLFSAGIDPGAPPTSGGLEECQSVAFNQIENSASSPPSFNIFYFGPGHTVYYKETDITPETWPARYLNNYAIARNRLYAYLEHITRNDPESIIITMGDHGAHSLDYIWYMKPDFQQKLKDASVSAADLYLDLCAILFAIKTPAYINLEGFWPCPINIFPFLIAQLSGNSSIWKNRAKEISLLVERKGFYVLGIHGKPYSLMPLMSEFDFSSIGHATDGLPSSKAEHSAEEKMTAKQTEAPQAYYETEAGPICFLTDNDELPAARPASQTGHKRSTQAVLLLQPLPISNISYAELTGDHLYFISQNKLWLLRDPFQASAANAERLPLQEARPVFLFQNGSDLHLLLKHETTELWKKSGGQWERECLWPYGAPQHYADAGKAGCLILSAMDNGLSVLHLARDGSISELPGALFGGDPKSINILGSTIYISTANPFGMAECAINEFERWTQSGREGNPFQFSPLATGHGICNMLESNQDIIVARSGRTELKTLSGETVFLDEESGQCGYLTSAILTPPAAHGFHIVGTGMRDEKHPRAILYVLNPQLKAVLKKRGEMPPVKPYCGYSRRNRSPVADKSVIANTAGWPVLIAAYESHEQFREDQTAAGLRVEYVDKDIIIYSRDSMFAGHKDGSSGSCFMSVSPKSKDKIAYDSGFYKSGQTGWPFCRLIKKATANVPLPATLPFPEIRLKYEDMENCGFTSLIPTQYRIEWNGVHFDFLVHHKSPGKNVVALGTGHVDKRRQAVPQYARYTWGKDLGASCIWYSDPALYLKPGELYWGYGLKDRWFLKDLAHLITIIASKIGGGGGNANLLFFGSSGAGFTSIALAALTRTIAFAINPQLDCLSYSETATKCFMDTCMAPNEQPDQTRLNVVRLIAREDYCPEIFILQNLTAGHDITNQIVPFIIACEQLEFSGNPIHISFYKAAGGHGAQPPKDLVIQIIHEILSHAQAQGAGS